MRCYNNLCVLMLMLCLLFSSNFIIYFELNKTQKSLFDLGEYKNYKHYPLIRDVLKYKKCWKPKNRLKFWFCNTDMYLKINSTDVKYMINSLTRQTRLNINNKTLEANNKYTVILNLLHIFNFQWKLYF